MTSPQRCLCQSAAPARPLAATASPVASPTARSAASSAWLLGAAASPVHRLQATRLLQNRSVLGNRAMQAVVRRLQRKKLTDAEKALDLQSDALKNDERLQQAFDNAPLLRSGETSDGVKTLQRALRDLGYPMPVSFANTGDADGIFGDETRRAVLKFESDHTLEHRDGIVGRETLQTMDALLGTTPVTPDPPEPTVRPCRFDYKGSTMSDEERGKFLQDHFTAADRPGARLILDDLCDVELDRLSFATEQELRDEVMMRLKLGQYMQQSQTTGGFAYPESAKDCPGKSGNPLLDAQVNVDARAHWHGLIPEQRAAIRNSHYFFELTPDVGMKDGYQALKLLFNPKTNLCEKTLFHCDTLITMTRRPVRGPRRAGHQRHGEARPEGGCAPRADERLQPVCARCPVDHGTGRSQRAGRRGRVGSAVPAGGGRGWILVGPRAGPQCHARPLLLRTARTERPGGPRDHRPAQPRRSDAIELGQPAGDVEVAGRAPPCRRRRFTVGIANGLGGFYNRTRNHPSGKPPCRNTCAMAPR